MKLPKKFKTPADDNVRAAMLECPVCHRVLKRGKFLEWIEEHTAAGVFGHYEVHQNCEDCRKAGRRAEYKTKKQ